MVDFSTLTPENINMFAMKHYDNPTCVDEKEFLDDMKRFKYLKRLFKKYSKTGILKERLIMNHIIVLQNVFGAEVAVTLLLFKIDKKYWSILKTCLDYLGYLYPHELTEFKKDNNIEEMLKEL